jgi:hypothetical protein
MLLANGHGTIIAANRGLSAEHARDEMQWQTSKT